MCTTVNLKQEILLRSKVYRGRSRGGAVKRPRSEVPDRIEGTSPNLGYERIKENFSHRN